MSLVNICTAELGASILGFSSTSDEEICQASHVLLDKEDVSCKRLRKSGTVEKDCLST